MKRKKQLRLTIREQTLELLIETKLAIKKLGYGFFSNAEIVEILLENISKEELEEKFKNK